MHRVLSTHEFPSAFLISPLAGHVEGSFGDKCDPSW